MRSPGNPGHYWGNFLVFDDAPVDGDEPRWEAAFVAAFGSTPGVNHRTLVWDRVDGFQGEAREEFLAAGYELWQNAGLTASPADLHPHPRANSEVEVRELDPVGDQALWDAVLAIWVAGNKDKMPEEDYRRWAVSRIAELRAMFQDGRRGGWFVALDRGEAVGSLGIVVTGPRARYQQVDTVLSHRRRGIASRLVFDAADTIQRRHPEVETFVIVADPEYHALAIYESLGFRIAERVTGVFRTPTSSASSS